MTNGWNDPNNAETVAIRPNAQAPRRGDDGFADPAKTVVMPGAGAGVPGSGETKVVRPDQVPAPDSSSNRQASGIDPVVGILVVIGGPGKGAFRGLFYGNNPLGRSAKERVPLDFGDEAISQTEQAFIRYDHESRCFWFIPNLAKPNIVYVNDEKPMAPVELSEGSEIRIGQTRLRFFPICGHMFDWSDIKDQ